MARIPQETIDEILRRANMVDIVGRYTQLRKQGSAYLGLCPFHSERTPSFRVNPERGVFFCFGCQEKGGLLQFLSKVENLDFVETVKKLGSEVGIEVLLDERPDDPEVTRRRRLLELLERCSLYYHELLTRSPVGKEALAYLEGRGIRQETIQRFRLGWAPDSGQALLRKLESSGYQGEEGELVGVLRQRHGRYTDTLRGRVVFPIFDTQDRVLAFGGRVLDQSQPKYLNTPETFLYSKRRNLYGLNLHRQEISRQDRALVVEGYLDVVSLDQVGVGLGVASLGTALTSEQCALLRRYTRQVVLAYDADRAGESATLKGIELFEEAGLRVEIAPLPPGEDPDSLARNQGKTGVEAVLSGATAVIDYLMDKMAERFDLSRPEGKEDYAREVLPALEKITDRVRRDAYVVRLANRMRISEQQIAWRLQSKEQGTRLRRQRGKIDPRTPEARLFRICVAHLDWFRQVQTSFRPEWVVSERYRPLFNALWQVEISEQPLQLQDLARHLEDPEASADLTELLLEPPPSSTWEDVEKLIQSLCAKHDLLRLEQLRREVPAEIEAGTLKADDERYLEYIRLQKRLKGAR